LLLRKFAFLEVPYFLKNTTKALLRRNYVSNLEFSRLENAAENSPHDPFRQAAYLKALNETNLPQEVVRRVESGAYAENAETKQQYLQALLNISDFKFQDPSKAFQNYPGYFAGIASKQQGMTSPSNNSTLEQMQRQLLQQQQQQQLYNHQQQEKMRIPQFSSGSDEAMAPVSSLGSKNNPMFVVNVPPNSRMNSFFRFLFASLVIYLLYVAYRVVSKGVSNVSIGGAGNPLQSIMGNDPEPIPFNPKRFRDVKGIDECLEELKEIVDFLKDPQKYTKLGGRLPKGILLVGPPGTGKTLLAKAIAGEAGVPFFYAGGSEFDEMFVGVGAMRVRKLFAAARKQSPCIVFIDEIDSLAGKRSAFDHHYSKQSINQLLAEMDGFKDNDNIIVIGATNLVEALDPAVLRPGRFDKHIEVPLPNVSGREEIINLYLSKTLVNKDMNVHDLAKKTAGFSGADLENLVNLAAIEAAKHRKRNVGSSEMDFAFDRIVIGLENKSLKKIMKEIDKKKTAIHETGHAIVAFYKSEDELHKVTIIPRGRTLGVTYNIHDDTYNYSKRELLNQIERSLGGIVAEEIFFGVDEVTTGAASDLEAATDIARRMVTKHGMSNLGPVDMEDKDKTSGETKMKIDAEVLRILTESRENVRQLLTQRKDDVQKVADKLVEYETLSGKEVKDILDGKEIRNTADKTYVNFG